MSAGAPRKRVGRKRLPCRSHLARPVLSLYALQTQPIIKSKTIATPENSELGRPKNMPRARTAYA
ncbi:hypothetical protein MZUP3_270 [Erwinia phage vB_EhrS_49]|uniref:Uncharacterized protein n=1 Tax=Erwinia phage vB_EhrS_49 TaxID=2283026 RepID=A0A4Y1NR27_9CAUD|nr:hypothetical protein HOV54_gp27 [Erwinia phage vB_EhrS_49]AXH43449.1 hypothetical protein MZUP3_270 [Erwinia phage vB_EhrS_49]